MIVTLEISPEQPPIAIAGDLTITPAGPFNSDSITVNVNAGLEEFGASETFQLSDGITNAMVTKGSTHTRVLEFNFPDKQQHFIRVAGKSYNLRLLSIDRTQSEAPFAKSFVFQVDEVEMELAGIHKEGNVAFWCKPNGDDDWSTNDKKYHIVRENRGPIAFQVIKHEDKTLEVSVAGPLGEVFITRKPLSPCEEKGVFIAITWANGEVKFYFNAQQVDTVQVGD